MEHARKRIMRCKHPTPCELCLADCRRAEIAAKEAEIRSELLEACKKYVELIEKASRRDRTQYEIGRIGHELDAIMDAAIAKATG